MRAFFSDERMLRNRQQLAQAGEGSEDLALPARALALRHALSERGILPVAPPDYGVAPLRAVHSAAYLAFLESAFERWAAQAGAGSGRRDVVLPSLSPYYTSQCGGADRGGCPSDAIVAQAGYYLGDQSSPIGEHSWQAILRSAHCAVAAAEYVCAQEARNDVAYALSRPAGHHAHCDRASGACYVNNAAVAAEVLLHSFDKVAVLDVGAHHGDGTQQIFYERADVMTISLHADPAMNFPFYAGYAKERGYGAGYGYNLNYPLRYPTDDAGYLAVLDTALDALRDYRPGALVLALGFDACGKAPSGALHLGPDAFRGIGERINALGVPTVVVQEGHDEIEGAADAIDAFFAGFAPVAAHAVL